MPHVFYHVNYLFINTGESNYFLQGYNITNKSWCLRIFRGFAFGFNIYWIIFYCHDNKKLRDNISDHLLRKNRTSLPKENLLRKYIAFNSVKTSSNSNLLKTKIQCTTDKCLLGFQILYKSRKNQAQQCNRANHSSFQIQGLLVSMSAMLDINSETKMYAFLILTDLRFGAADLFQVNPIIKHFPP